jgi:hypothetical protein
MTSAFADKAQKTAASGAILMYLSIISPALFKSIKHEV